MNMSRVSNAVSVWTFNYWDINDSSCSKEQAVTRQAAKVRAVISTCQGGRQMKDGLRLRCDRPGQLSSGGLVRIRCMNQTGKPFDSTDVGGYFPE